MVTRIDRCPLLLVFRPTNVPDRLLTRTIFSLALVLWLLKHRLHYFVDHRLWIDDILV